jgi:hypothetical protein
VLSVGRVRELVDLLESYVEARVERCVSKGYALLYGDWRCVVGLLVESGVVEGLPPAVPAPDPITASALLLELGCGGGDCVVVTPAPLVVAVRMGSSVYDSIIRALSELTGCKKWKLGFKQLAVSREGDTCVALHLQPEEEPAEPEARKLAKVLVAGLRWIVKNMVEGGACPSERKCLERALEYLRTAKGCK